MCLKLKISAALIVLLLIGVLACTPVPQDTEDDLPVAQVITNFVTNTVTQYLTNQQVVTNLVFQTNFYTNITTNQVTLTNVITNLVTNITIVPLTNTIISAALSGTNLLLSVSVQGPADWVEVRINDIPAGTYTNQYTNISIDLSPHSAVYYNLEVTAWNSWTNSAPDNRFINGIYSVPEAVTAPVIDGNGGDACWTAPVWVPLDQLWLDFGNGYPSASDFSARAKVVWRGNVLYVLAEVTDDVLNDAHPNWYDSYWEDDTFEIFLDEDNSGGDHELNENAYAYHCSLSGDAVDINSGGAVLYNSHVVYARQLSGTLSTWEFAVTVYNSSLTPVAALWAGKQMGFTLAYCDNDGGYSRQHFMGLNIIDQTDKNVAYKNADFFGTIYLR